MAEREENRAHGPELENEVLIETVRRLPKQGVWYCGTRCYALGSGGDTGDTAVILAAVGDRKERLLTLSSADDGRYDSLLKSFAQALVLRGEGPQEIRAEDDLSEEILDSFCRTVGITLKRDREAAPFRDAEWQSEHPETGEKGAEADSFFQMLLRLHDEEFARMPRDLAERLLKMSEEGLAPKKLAERIQMLCQG